MGLESLKNSFLAAMPVVGPHSGIEAELLLAGKKPIGYISFYPEEEHSEEPEAKRDHEVRQRLDDAVAEGRLVSVDTYQHYPHLGKTATVRHYAQPKYADDMQRLAHFNQCAYDGEALPKLEKPVGQYLGYRNRDRFFFDHVLQSDIVPMAIKRALVALNVPCQDAYRKMQINEAAAIIRQPNFTQP